MDINQVYEEIGNAKKNGEFHAVVNAISIDRNLIINKLRRDNFIIIEVPGKIIITWIGCKEWAEINGLQYDKLHVIDPAFTEIINIIKNVTNSQKVDRIKFLNPNLVTFFESKYNKSTGEVESTVKREDSIKNQLFSTINKF